jgi:hypothetical protein
MEEAMQPGATFDKVLNGNDVVCAYWLYAERFGMTKKSKELS